MRTRLKDKWLVSLLVLLGFTPLLWYLGRGDVLINGLDTNFPLDPSIWFERRFFAWDSVINAGRDFSSSTSGLLFHFVQVFPQMLGFDLRAIQVFSLLFWFFAIIVSSYVFSRSFVRGSRLAQATFVVFYSFNIYLFNTWENVKVSNLSLVVCLPLLLGVLNNFRMKRIDVKKLLLQGVPISFLAMGTGINPSYFTALVLGVVIFIVVTILTPSSSGERKRFVFAGLFVLGEVVLINMFWILPLLNFMFVGGSVSSLGDLGFTNWIESLSRNTSLVNVIRLQGAWDWYEQDAAGMPLYIPYALNYFRRPLFVAFSFLVPMLALVSLVVRDKKLLRYYIFLTTMVLVGVFLGAGVHPPTGSIYRVLVRYVPYFSFFRSPWYIFTPYVVVGLSGLVSLLVMVMERRLSVFKNLLGIVVGVVLVGQLVYSYPLITGKIFRPDRGDSFYITFPDYLWQAKEWLEEKEGVLRIVSYPDDELESFLWGYKGTESVLGLLMDVEMIAPSFNYPNKSMKSLLRKYYSHVKRGEYESAVAMLEIFGANMMFVKNDSSSLAPKIDSSLESLMNKSSFGQWDFYKKENGQEKIYLAENYYINQTGDDALAALTKMMKPKFAIVNDGDSQIVDVEGISVNSNLMGGGQSEDGGVHLFTIERSGNYLFYLEKTGVSLSDLTFYAEGFSLEGADFLDLESMIVVGPVYVSEGDVVIGVNYPKKISRLTPRMSQDYSVAELRSSELPENLNETFVIYSSEDVQKKVKIPFDGYDSFKNYKLSFDYKYIYGSVPIIEVIQSAPTAPLKVTSEVIGSSMDWDSVEMLIESVPTNSKLEVFISIPPNNETDKSKMFIENMVFEEVNDGGVYYVEQRADSVGSGANVAFKKISPVKYKVKLRGMTEGQILVFLENYSKDWRIRSDDLVKEPNHFMTNGYANGWYIPSSLDDIELEIYYYPQLLLNVGLGISITSIVMVLLFSEKVFEKVLSRK